MGRPKGSRNSTEPGVSVETNPYTQQIQETANAVQPTTPQRAAPQYDEDDDSDAPQSQTLRKVEVLSNLANACRNKDVVKAIKALPDGKIILGIFTEALQSKINQIMTGQQEQNAVAATDLIQDNVGSVLNMAASLEKIMVHMHQSPLIQVLQALTANLNKPRAPEQPQQYAPQYQPQPQQPNQQQPQAPLPLAQGGTPAGVTPYYESQIEQTPKFTQARKGTSGPGPAPTSPPRGDGFNSW